MELGGTRWNRPEVVRLDFAWLSQWLPIKHKTGRACTMVTEGGQGRGQGTLSEEVCLLSTRGLGPGGREEEAQLALDCAGRQTEA